ncbi:MAG: isoprenyl transferase [Lachnospiraceae bacterium]|nr:isoprenyl transferase [Lachnospiraceae bacterium]
MGTKEKIELDMNNMPKHIAIIMDGNGRWAKKRNLPKKAGHKAGADTLENILNVAEELGVMHITAYAFSTENWKRSEDEVTGIMDLLRKYLKEHIRSAQKRKVKVNIIGDTTRLDNDIQQQILKLEEITKDKPGLNLHIALNYGGRDELLRAVKKIAQKTKDAEIAPEDITEEFIEQHLDTTGVPDPELVIRTSGEERVSNFLLWQIAYSEFSFSDKLWPDYTENDFKQAIWEYQNRDRRFGGRNS